jgi:hypothetical protein
MYSSFEGGLIYEIENNGLTAHLVHDKKNNYISVCGERCELDEEKSNNGKAVCKLPKIHSTLTMPVDDSKLPIEAHWSGLYFGTGKSYQNAFDRRTGTGTNDNTANCHVGMKFQHGYIGELYRVNMYLMN